VEELLLVTLAVVTPGSSIGCLDWPKFCRDDVSYWHTSMSSAEDCLLNRHSLAAQLGLSPFMSFKSSCICVEPSNLMVDRTIYHIQSTQCQGRIFELYIVI
jgi:hypothetical protein